MKPLLKWAGGKRQIIQHIVKLLPASWNRYYEPFAGGLALLSELGNRGLVSSAIISDTNPELINLYRQVKDSAEALIKTVSEYGFENEKDYYYQTRSKFNEIIGKNDRKLERAAIMLYLNRFGYNGLWRVNSKGSFNVPFGKYVNSHLPSRDQILQFSELLKKVDIALEDFQTIALSAKKGDLVYFDPPYFPVSHTAYFTDYTAGGFSMKDQRRLYETCQELNKEGVNFILSNSHSQELLDMYREFQCFKIESRRNINSASNKRKGHFDLLVANQD